LARIRPGHGAPLPVCISSGRSSGSPRSSSPVSMKTRVYWRRCSILASSWAMLCCRSGIRKSGVVVVSWVAWSWFLVWVRSLLRAAMGCVQARLVRTRASGVARAGRGGGISIDGIGLEYVAASPRRSVWWPWGSLSGSQPGIIQDPAYPSLAQGSDQGLMGGVLDLTVYPIHPSRWFYG